METPTAAVLHGVANQGLICVELGGRGLYVVIAEDHATYLRGADVVGHVDADALLFEAREILPEGAPVGSDVVVIVAGAVGLDDGVIDGRD